MMLPVAVDLDQRHVALYELASADFSEAFLSESLARAVAESPDACAWAQGFGDFVQSTRRLSRAPDGFIFHVGRCGSTLLSNMLQASGEHLLIKEPDVVNDVMAGWLKAEGAERDELERVLDGAVRALVAAPTSAERYRLLKLAAWNVRGGVSLLRLFPAAKSLFVFRSPLETVASLLFEPPGWFGLLHRERAVQARFFPSVGEVPARISLSPHQLYAHAFRSTAEAVFELPRASWLAIEYQALVQRPDVMLRRALGHLGHRVSEEQLQRMSATLAIYSKGATRSVRFEPNGKHQRPPLSNDQAAEVLAIAGDAWQKLRAYASAAPSRPGASDAG